MFWLIVAIIGAIVAITGLSMAMISGKEIPNDDANNDLPKDS